MDTSTGALFAPARAVLDEMEGISERWSDGIAAAVENYNAEQTVKQGKDEKAIIKLLANIDEVVENAVLLDTRLSDLDSENKKGSTQFMHILYAPVEYNGATFLAKITVEEYREDGILRAYNAQRIKMSSLPRSHFQQLNKAASARNSRLHDDEIMVSQLYDLVKQHDADFNSRL